MTKHIRSFLTIFLLIAVMEGICTAGSEEAGLASTRLVYSRQSNSQTSSSLLKSSTGAMYRLLLIPDLDVEKHVVVLNLVLQKEGRKTDDSNLLDSTGKLHGYQPYFFAASDFAHGAKNSIYGDTRVIDLPRLGMEVHIKVVDVNVEPLAQISSDAAGYQFNDLTLLVTTQKLAKGDSMK